MTRETLESMLRENVDKLRRLNQQRTALSADTLETVLRTVFIHEQLAEMDPASVEIHLRQAELLKKLASRMSRYCKEPPSVS